MKKCNNEITFSFKIGTKWKIGENYKIISGYVLVCPSTVLITVNTIGYLTILYWK